MLGAPSFTRQISCEDHSRTLTIIAHRACVNGPDARLENTLEAIRGATSSGLSVEFDVRVSTDGRLVLAHDPCAWSSARDPYPFLRNPDGPPCHALNIKSVYAVPAILNVLRAAGSAHNFFLFDFELLTNDLPGCRFLMRSLQDEGFRVGYRLSDREPFLDHYLRDPSVREVWLDEFDRPWVTRDVVQSLCDRGIRSYYVSPELHGARDRDTVHRRWEDLVGWGVQGICTDYPLQLASLYGGAS
ncbi:MAG: glycerophosphodiester phosphodiesterase family protein [Chthonomonadales bacterium]